MANPSSSVELTQMVATDQHKATSAIRSAEEQKSVQNWRSSPTSNTLILNTGHRWCSQHPLLLDQGQNQVLPATSQVELDRCHSRPKSSSPFVQHRVKKVPRRQGGP